MSISRLNRRYLLYASALAGGGLMLELTLPAKVLAVEDGALVRSKELNVYVKIEPNGQITIYSSIPDMGPGIKTSLPMISHRPG